MKILKESAEEKINDKLRKLKARKGRSYFLTHIDYPTKEKDKDKKYIIEYADRTEKILPEIKDLLDTFKKNISPIWEQTKYTASYLLICKAYCEINPIITLAKEGSSHEVIELTRSALEALDLSFLFLEEQKEEYLKKWFKGKVIGNSEAREMYEKIINETNKESKDKVPLNEVKGDVYWVYSLFTHNGYSALLESVDVFYEDYDFKKYAGFHYTAKNLHLIDNLIINILLSLKNVFLKFSDPVSYDKVHRLMQKLNYKDASTIELKEIFDKYKK